MLLGYNGHPGLSVKVVCWLSAVGAGLTELLALPSLGFAGPTFMTAGQVCLPTMAAVILPATSAAFCCKLNNK